MLNHLGTLMGTSSISLSKMQINWIIQIRASHIVILLDCLCLLFVETKSGFLNS